MDASQAGVEFLRLGACLAQFISNICLPLLRTFTEFEEWIMNINEILEQHQIWLETFCQKGVRANFCDANLRGADLSNAN